MVTSARALAGAIVGRAAGHRSAAAGALVVAMALTGAGCGSSSSNSSGNGGGSAKKGFKVGVLTPGTGNDGSWGQAVVEGANQYAKKYGATVRVATNLNDPSQYQQQGNAFASAGYNVVVNANASMTSVTVKLAKQYPNVKFGQVGAAITPLPPNVGTSTPDLSSGQFIAGYMAGLVDKTGVVGAIGGFNFPQINQEMEGFALGARYANPKIKVVRTYVNTWTDVGKAAAAAQAQASQGADVIFSATDQATEGMYRVAQGGNTKLKYVIPQYFNKASEAPTVVLTSVLYNLQGVTGQFIQEYASGNFPSQNVERGLSFGTGKLAPNPTVENKLPASVKSKVAKLTQEVMSGKIKVPGLDVLGKPGAADRVDLSSLKA